MITLKEAALVLAKINAHHGNAQATKLQVECFHEELRPYVTLQIAMDAVREFYASDETGRWMGSGDVNSYARRVLDASLPSESDIIGMAVQAGVTEGRGVWQFRRSFLKACAAGMPMSEARGIAARQATSPSIEGPGASGKQPTKALPQAIPTNRTHDC